MKIIIWVVLCLLSFGANAAFHCQVDVNRVLVYSNGLVNVLHTGRNDYTVICSIRGVWKGIDTVTCSHWIGMLQSTQNNNKKAVFYYDGDGSCNTLSTYSSSPAPVYIGSIK